MCNQPAKWQDEARSDALGGALLLIGSLREYVACLETALDLERNKVLALQAQCAMVRISEVTSIVANSMMGA